MNGQVGAVWHGWSPVAHATRPQIVRGEGWHVWDSRGQKYLDATSSALNAVCGYGDPRVVEAVRSQVGQLHHFELSRFTHPLAEQLAERLAGLLGAPLSWSLFTNSGSEAVEAAVRMSLDYWLCVGTPRNRVVTLSDGYHGSTALCQELSGLPHLGSPWTGLVDVRHVPVPPGRSARTEAGRAELRAALAYAMEPDDEGRPPAALLLEPLLNVGGGIVLPDGFLQDARRECDRTGALLVIDEVFTGFGRSGAMFGHQHDDVRPDIVTMSKGLAGGYVPVGAVTTTSQVHDAFAAEPVIGGLRYGHTTSGHAVACAAALATLDVIEESELVSRSATSGVRLLTALESVMSTDGVVDVRGRGLVTSVELASSELAGRVVEVARQDGLIVRQQGATVMAAPPLVIDEAGIDEIAEVLQGALATVLDDAAVWTAGAGVLA